MASENKDKDAAAADKGAEGDAKKGTKRKKPAAKEKKEKEPPKVGSRSSDRIKTKLAGGPKNTSKMFPDEPAPKRQKKEKKPAAEGEAKPPKEKKAPTPKKASKKSKSKGKGKKAKKTEEAGTEAGKEAATA